MLFPTRLVCLALLALKVTARKVEHITYSTVQGYFEQDDPRTNASTFDYAAANFGLISRSYDTDGSCDPKHVKTQWQRFEAKVQELNRKSERHTQYKVLFMGRHGEGYHNAAESYYGTPAWNCYWSEKDGNATVVWADAHLTPKGAAQAEVANAFWASEIKNQKIPTPQSFYTSPLSRCLATAKITFSGLHLNHPFVPTVKELFREGISGHTCDRRSNRTYIRENYPGYKIEMGFSEQDLLWRPLMGETSVDEDIRSKKVLDEVFMSDSSTWLSITSHSGEIASILRVLGHQAFSLNTGAVIPVLVQAQTAGGSSPATATQSYTSLSTCSTQPPLPTGTA